MQTGSNEKALRRSVTNLALNEFSLKKVAWLGGIPGITEHNLQKPSNLKKHGYL